MRLIDADALAEAVGEWYCKKCDSRNFARCSACDIADVISVIETAPTVAGDINVIYTGTGTGKELEADEAY